MEKPQKERPVFPGRKTRNRNFFDERGVSPVIAVILMVAITVVLAAVLYVMVSALLDGPPENLTLSMNWNEKRDAPGNYTGYIIKISSGDPPNLEDVTVVIINDDNMNSETLDVLKESGTLAAGTVTIRYNDIDDNNSLGVVDIFTVTGISEGDTIRLTHRDAGQMHSKTF
jgi:flagellin-like protein